MSDVFNSIKNGLDEAIENGKSGNNSALVYKPVPVDVKAIREKTKMTQEKFAACFGISVSTVRHWERGDRKPQGPALVLLNLLDKDHEKVLETLYC